MIVWGGKDFVFDDAFLRQWQKYLPQAQVHRLADAGHYVLEDAAEEVIPLISGFIRT
jgi:haloalkane dehalogenase